MARLLPLRIDFIDIPPDRTEAFAGDLFERRDIDDLDLRPACTPLYGSELNQASTSFLKSRSLPGGGGWKKIFNPPNPERGGSRALLIAQNFAWALFA